VSFTPPPAPPPAAAPIPSRRLDDQVTFDLKTDTYLTWTESLRNWLATFMGWLANFRAEIVDVQEGIAVVRDQANSAAVAAAVAADTALATAHFRGLWQDLAGPLARPASVKHNGRIWLLLADLANVAASEPGVSADWTSTDAGVLVQEITVSTAMVPGVRYVVKTAGITLSAPTVLLAGDRLSAVDASGGGFYVDWVAHTIKGEPPQSPMRVPALRGFDVTYSGSTLA